MANKMVPRNADGVLSYLEKKSSDELSLLESVGTEYFSTAELIRLKGQWEIKNKLFIQFQKYLIRIVAFSPVWLVGWFIFHLLHLPALAMFSLMLFPLSFMLFFSGLLFMRHFFPGKGHLDYIGDMINLELHRRRLVEC